MKIELPNAVELQKIADQYPHPGVSLYNEYMEAWNQLDDTDRALHKIAETQTYCNYISATKYGHQVYNIQQNK